jgi:hypothetical protein
MGAATILIAHLPAMPGSMDSRIGELANPDRFD